MTQSIVQSLWEIHMCVFLIHNIRDGEGRETEHKHHAVRGTNASDISSEQNAILLLELHIL